MNKMSFLVFSIFVLLGVSLSTQQEPTKPTWPDQFSMPFGLNWGIVLENASAMMYYNYDQAQAQLLDYHTHCFPLVKINSVAHPCKMLFIPKGIYVSIPSLSIDCCLFVADVGAVPPTFLQGFNYSGYNDTETDMYGKKHDTLRWDGAEDFKYWTDIPSGDDVKFQDGPTGVTWSFGEMNVTSQNVSMFNLPGKCDSKCGFLDFNTFVAPEDVAIPFFNLKL